MNEFTMEILRAGFTLEVKNQVYFEKDSIMVMLKNGKSIKIVLKND